MDTRTDEALLTAYRKGDPDALEALIRRYHDDLMRFLLRLVGNRAGAEDVFQETFLQIHTSAGTFDTSRRFKPWLFTIAANKGRDHLRRSNRRRALDLSAPVGGGGGGSGGGDEGTTFVDLLEIDVTQPSQGTDDDERDRTVQQAIDGMPDILREVLLLAYFQRMSYNQVAEALEIPLGTVKSRLHAAVALFARRWKAANEARATND